MRLMNGHIVAPFRRRPGLFHLPQPAPACLVGLGRSPGSIGARNAFGAGRGPRGDNQLTFW